MWYEGSGLVSPKLSTLMSKQCWSCVQGCDERREVWLRDKCVLGVGFGVLKPVKEA